MCQRAMRTRFDSSEIRKIQKVASLSAQALSRRLSARLRLLARQLRSPAHSRGREEVLARSPGVAPGSVPVGLHSQQRASTGVAGGRNTLRSVHPARSYTRTTCGNRGSVRARPGRRGLWPKGEGLEPRAPRRVSPATRLSKRRCGRSSSPFACPFGHKPTLQHHRLPNVKATATRTASPSDKSELPTIRLPKG
jgi:hypothetical protein